MKKQGIYKDEAAATVIDNSNGTVVAIVGEEEHKKGNTYNREPYYLRRQRFCYKAKPFLIAYTPAFENGYYPDEMYMDEPIEKWTK